MSEDQNLPDSTEPSTTLDDVLAALSLSNIYAARNYDVLMAILREHNPEMTTAIESYHERGLFISSPPVLADSPFGVENTDSEPNEPEGTH